MNLRLVFRVNEKPLPITDELDAGETFAGETCRLVRGVGWQSTGLLLGCFFGTASYAA